MQNGWRSSQFWYTIVIAVASTAALLAGKITPSEWVIAVTGVSAGLGVRKALEHMAVGSSSSNTVSNGK